MSGSSSDSATPINLHCPCRRLLADPLFELPPQVGAAEAAAWSSASVLDLSSEAMQAIGGRRVPRPLRNPPEALLAREGNTRAAWEKLLGLGRLTRAQVT